MVSSYYVVLSDMAALDGRGSRGWPSRGGSRPVMTWTVTEGLGAYGQGKAARVRLGSHALDRHGTDRLDWACQSGIGVDRRRFGKSRNVKSWSGMAVRDWLVAAANGLDSHGRAAKEWKVAASQVSARSVVRRMCSERRGIYSAGFGPVLRHNKR